MGFFGAGLAATVSYGLMQLFGAKEEFGFALLAGLVVIWIASAIPVLSGGHRAFKTGVNTDLTAYAVGLALFIAVVR